jgi:hypothetical protein
MYPMLESGPKYQPQKVITRGQMERQEIDDEFVIEEVNAFAKTHPLTPKAQYLNLAFQGVSKLNPNYSSSHILYTSG